MSQCSASVVWQEAAKDRQGNVANVINEWFDTMQSLRQPLTESLIRLKALHFTTLHIGDFGDSKG